MTGAADLERRYRRLLALYPRSFRREHADELLGVLLAGAREGQRRPGPAESADLIRGAIRMHVRRGGPRPTPTVSVAIGLMYLGAALELLTLTTVLVTLGSVRSAVAATHPDLAGADGHAVVLTRIVPLAVGASIATAVWLWLAWANGRGHGWARLAFAAFFAITTLSLLNGLADGAGTYAPADLIAGGLLWLVALGAVALIFNKRSLPHYRAETHAREGDPI